LTKIILLFLALVVFDQRDKILHYINPPPDYAALHDGKVILYATSWCGYCKKARQFLDQKKIPYFEYDIEKSEEGKRQHRALGGSGVPVLLVNGSVIKGYSPSEILANL
jgi:glutaredoxin